MKNILTVGMIIGTALQTVTAFEIGSFNLAPNGARLAECNSDKGSYYILYGGAEAGTIGLPLALALGTGGNLVLTDTNSPGIQAFYQVRQVNKDRALDVDGDGMSDLFELTYPGCLNPLNPFDAAADCDGDGSSNLREYENGTDPTQAGAIAGGLVINEIDYDQPGVDSAEFVELFNAGTNTIALGNLALVFINGANSNEYLRVSLATAGSIQPGEFLVLGSSNIVVGPGVHQLFFTAAEGSIQNGSPDGVILVETVTHRVFDSLSYEGSIRASTPNGFPAPINLVEGTALASNVADSGVNSGALIRSPNGADSDDANADWRFANTPTPGMANP